MSTITDDRLESLRYPIGRFQYPETFSEEARASHIATLETLPEKLAKAVEGLTHEQLDTPYRDGGWTVRQVVHHLPDSHLNAYIRFKWALTEPSPTIKAYDEAAWAELEDAKRSPVEPSLQLLAALHDRWTTLLKSLYPSDFEREFMHPERGLKSLNATLALYDWHSRHHLAQIEHLRSQQNW